MAFGITASTRPVTNLATAVLNAPARVEPATTIVRVDALTKRYPARRTWAEIVRAPFTTPRATVLDSVSLDVRQGEFFGLLGPNGAGKTTFFKILSTLVLPDAGRVVVDGLDVVTDAASVRARVAPVIAEERSLAWRLSARENLKLYAALYGLPAHVARARIDEVLAVVGLEEAGPQIVAKFSSGMKQRLMIARGLLARPKVLLLDEPTRSLDPPAARRFREFLRHEIAGRQGCTVLLATHNTEEAFELCDRVGVLHRGSLVAVGTTAELSRRVAEERYRIWTARPGTAALTRASNVNVLSVQPAGSDGWDAVEIELSGGEAAASELLRQLVAAGIAVARLERVRVSLADLIERVIERS